jgi:hypothetical protein
MARKYSETEASMRLGIPRARLRDWRIKGKINPDVIATRGPLDPPIGGDGRGIPIGYDADAIDAIAQEAADAPGLFKTPVPA